MSANNMRPNFAIDDIKQNQFNELAYAQKLAEEHRKTQERAKLLQAHVYENSNPSPITITLIIIAVLIAIWFIYCTFVKPNMSGLWLDENSNKIRICHNRMSGSIKATIEELNGQQSTLTATIADNLVVIGEKTGIWDYQDLVVFISDGGLARVRG